jgi:aminomethyltransferase
MMISRTGYTGEFGFEIFVRPDAFVPLWEQLLEAGEPEGLIPCGLGARDSLRTGAGLPLSHQDLGEWPARNHPWEFALCWKEPGTRFEKPFHGADALLAATEADHTHVFLGENGRKVEAGADVLLDGSVIGTVLTCATDMAIGPVEDRILSLASPDAPADFAPKGLSCGFVKVNQSLSEGTAVTLKDKRRELQVTITSNVRPDRTARMRWPLA